MANGSGKKFWPHLQSRAPRYHTDPPPAKPLYARRRIRHVLAGAALLVALLALYPVLRQERAVRENENVATVTACDRLAADPDDTQKRAGGVPNDRLDVRKALHACQDALKRAPHDPRGLYQLARVSLAARDESAGIAYLRQSAAAGYAQGQFALGTRLLNGNGVAPDVCEAGRLWVLAARQPHFGAKLAVAHAWRAGTFKDCGLSIGESEVDDLLAAAGELAETPAQRDDLAQVRKGWVNEGR